MRSRLIAGNWKMNLDLTRARSLVAEIRGLLEDAPLLPAIEFAICPPAIYLFPMAKAISGSSIRLGAQNMYHEPSGAFTGEISAAMIRETGASYVLIGHSERRHLIGHHEDDRMLHLKLRAALASGLTPVLCVGETLEQRDRGETESVLSYQVEAALVDVALESSSLVIAYEPVWAIGTGRNATADQAQAAHAHIRARLARRSAELAASTRILYGGSLKPDNAGSLFACPDVDGGLIGGASLQAATFVAIARAAETQIPRS